MRICYFIQNHLPPAQVSRLIGTLRRSRPQDLILVGHDGFAGECAASEVRAALDTEVIAARRPARRGYFSLLEPYFDAVEWLEKRGVAYDWLVYLSAQDYPVQPLAELEARLSANRVDGFLRFWEAASPVNPWGRRRQGIRRYYYRYFEGPGWTRPLLGGLRWLNGLQPFLHLHLTYGARIGVRAGRSPFGKTLTCYAGTQWTILRRACAEYVTEAVRREDPLVRWFRHTVCPCEAVVQTLLVNSGRFELHNDDLRFVDVTGSKNGRPRTLTERDLPAVLQNGSYFARKFDLESSGKALDLLDARIG